MQQLYFKPDRKNKENKIKLKKCNEPFLWKVCFGFLETRRNDLAQYFHEND